MKKLFFLFVVTLLINRISLAQITYGVKAGVNFFTVSGDDYGTEDKKSKPGLAIGALLNYKVHEMFSVQPELVFQGKAFVGKIAITRKRKL